MEWLSPAALIGALLGLIVGWVDYRIIVGIVEGRLRKLDKSATQAEKDDFEWRIVWMRRLLFVATVVAFTIVGYFVGRTFGG